MQSKRVSRNHQSAGSIPDSNGMLDTKELLETPLKLNDQRTRKALRRVKPSRKNISRRPLVSFPFRPVKLADWQQLAKPGFCTKNGQTGLAGHSDFQSDFCSEPC